MTSAVRHCGVIGSPIDHSLSPQLHLAAYQRLGLDWEYTRHEVAADHVGEFLAGLDPSWRGVSVTMPCKKAIVVHGIPDAESSALGVANTLVFDGDPNDVETTRVANTDVPGIAAVLTALGVRAMDQVDVWGNGATARSTVLALSRVGVTRLGVRARDDLKTRALAEAAATWGMEVVEPRDAAQVIISTIPPAAAAQWFDHALTATRVFDVLYNPWPTPLASWAKACGKDVATGIDLLAAQAVKQIQLMTGQYVPMSLLTDAGLRALSQ